MTTSKPKAYAIILIILEILCCILIYLLCVFLRRRRCGHKLRDCVWESGVIRARGPKLVIDSSVLVFIPCRALKNNFDQVKTTSLRCKACLREFNNNDGTLRLMINCGHVFHPCCLVDPCSSLCPCYDDAIIIEGDKKGKNVIDEVVISEFEVDDKAIDEIEVVVEGNDGKFSVVVDEAVVKAMDVILDGESIDEKCMTKLPKEVVKKVIVYGKIVSSKGKVYSQARSLW